MVAVRKIVEVQLLCGGVAAVESNLLDVAFSPSTEHVVEAATGRVQVGEPTRITQLTISTAPLDPLLLSSLPLFHLIELHTTLLSSLTANSPSWPCPLLPSVVLCGALLPSLVLSCCKSRHTPLDQVWVLLDQFSCNLVECEVIFDCCYTRQAISSPAQLL